MAMELRAPENYGSKHAKFTVRNCGNVVVRESAKKYCEAHFGIPKGKEVTATLASTSILYFVLFSHRNQVHGKPVLCVCVLYEIPPSDTPSFRA